MSEGRAGPGDRSVEEGSCSMAEISQRLLRLFASRLFVRAPDFNFIQRLTRRGRDSFNREGAGYADAEFIQEGLVVEGLLICVAGDRGVDLLVGHTSANFRIVGDRFQHDMWHGFVTETASNAFIWMRKFVIAKVGRHEPLFGECDRDARRVAGDPSTAPLLSNKRRRSRAASRVKYQVARVGRHQHAALYNLRGSLNNVLFILRPA